MTEFAIQLPGPFFQGCRQAATFGRLAMTVRTAVAEGSAEVERLSCIRAFKLTGFLGLLKKGQRVVATAPALLALPSRSRTGPGRRGGCNLINPAFQGEARVFVVLFVPA